MTDQQAQSWIVKRFGAEALARVEAFVGAVVDENDRQNLIAPSTINTVWTRHVLDSAQLLSIAPQEAKTWLDVGTGAGFPGMVVALLRPDIQCLLAEPRGRRVGFLEAVKEKVGASNVAIAATKAEALPLRIFDVISARAVAPTEVLFDITRHLRDRSTTYLLPRGRQGHDELVKLRRGWQGLFHVEQSLTDVDSTIIIASGVS